MSRVFYRRCERRRLKFGRVDEILHENDDNATIICLSSFELGLLCLLWHVDR